MSLSTPEIPNVIVVTDIGNDYDDMMALLILGYYHQQKKIRLKGVIVTLKPALRRAQMAYGLLNSCMKINVEVAVGTEDLVKAREHDKWTDEALRADFVSTQKTDFRTHLQLSKSVFESVEKEKQKIRFLSLAGLRTSWEIVEQDKDLFARIVSEVHCQGGCQWDPTASEAKGKVIKAREDARNNVDDMAAADKFYKFVQEKKIPCTAYEKEAAYTSGFKKTIFDPEAASESMKPVAEYIYKIHDKQKEVYYKAACGPEEDRFLKNMDREWFLKSCCKDLPDEIAKNKEAGAEMVIPYTIVTPYDPIAALGCIQDVAEVKLPLGPVQYPKVKGADGPQKADQRSQRSCSEQDPNELKLFATCKDLTPTQGKELAKIILDHMGKALGRTDEA
jgi:hypothetical protein